MLHELDAIEYAVGEHRDSLTLRASNWSITNGFQVALLFFSPLTSCMTASGPQNLLLLDARPERENYCADMAGTWITHILTSGSRGR